MTPIQETFKSECEKLRGACLEIEKEARGLTPCVSSLPEGVQFQEVNANLMLAVRHLEDARMRLGKAIQWGAQGGVSIFDQKPAGFPPKAPGEQYAAENEAGFRGSDYPTAAVRGG